MIASACVAFLVAACTADSFSGADGATCPALAGKYDPSGSGAACPSGGGPAICITQTGCTITFGAGNISGNIAIGTDGSFTNQAVMEGSLSRSGCDGTWDQGSATLSITCGGATDSSQSCVETLTRKSTSCN